MTLVVCHGNRGSGKTTIATGLARQAIDQGVPVWANYGIVGAKELTPSNILTIQGPALVIIDEAYVWLDSRVSASTLNRFMSYILFQSRKMGLDFVLTVQLIHTLDKRFRDLTDTYIACEHQKTKDRFKYEILSVQKSVVKTRYLSHRTAEKYIFPYFKTEERIDNNESQLMESMDHAEQNRIIDKWVDAAEDQEIEPKRDRIKDWCMRNGIPAKYSSYIYFRLRDRVGGDADDLR